MTPPRPAARRSLAADEAVMLLVCLIWGINFSVMKYALGSLAPMTLSAIRFTIASAALWVVARRLEPDVRLPRRTWWSLAALGVLGNTLYQIGFINGLAISTAGNSSLLIASTPLATAVLGAAIGAERITRAVGAAVAIGTLGVALVVLGHGRGVSFSSSTLPGDLLTLFAVGCWAVFTQGVRRVVGTVSPLQVAAVTTIGGTPGFLVLAAPDLARLDWSAISPGVWLAVAYAALLSIVFCYVMWNRSVQRIGPNRTALFGVTTPLFAMAVAAVALGERATPGQLVGALLIVLSVVVNVLAHRWQEASTPCEEGV